MVTHEDAVAMMTSKIRRDFMQYADRTDGISAKKVAEALGESVQLVAYHVGVLRSAGALERVGTVERRGAMESFYRATVRIGLVEDGPAVLLKRRGGLVSTQDVAVKVNPINWKQEQEAGK